MRELKQILKHRKTGTWNSLTNQIGHVGFDKWYEWKEELSEALTYEVNQRKDADKQVSALLQVKLSPLEWENQLQESCRNGDDQKVIIDLAQLFKSGISKTQSVQVVVINNLVSKLPKSYNHHYIDIVKDISQDQWYGRKRPTFKIDVRTQLGVAGISCWTHSNLLCVARTKQRIQSLSLVKVLGEFAM